MTNVSSTPEKIATRRGLFALAVKCLEAEGWEVTRVARGGKASLREIRRGAESARVSIRTSQDAWIAFPPKAGGAGWVTLDDVEFVVAASVDDKFSPREARVHLIPADVVRDAFDRAYTARKSANYVLPEGRGVWVSLYDKESSDPVTLVGAGLGLEYKPLLVHDLTKGPLPDDGDDLTSVGQTQRVESLPPSEASDDRPLTIAEAKRRLAMTLSVPESAIKITIEH